MENNIQIFLTIFFAALSAVFAWLSFWYARLAYIRDSHRVKLRLQQMIDHLGRRVFMIVITNTGRRPVNITSAFIQIHWTETYILINDKPNLFHQVFQIPKILNESDELAIPLLYSEILSLTNDTNLSHIVICDTYGNEYKKRIPYLTFPEIVKKPFIEYIKFWKQKS